MMAKCVTKNLRWWQNVLQKTSDDDKTHYKLRKTYDNDKTHCEKLIMMTKCITKNLKTYDDDKIQYWLGKMPLEQVLADEMSWCH